MKHIFAFIFSLIAFNTALAIIPDPVLDKRLKEHNEAYETLEKNLPHLGFYSQTTYYNNGAWSTKYSYFGSPEALDAHKKYSERFYNLVYKTYYNSFGNGFIIGIVAAILNKSLIKSKSYKYKIILPIISSMLSNIYENKKIGKVPFFNTKELTKRDNLFSNSNINSFGRIIASIGSSSLSYLGTEYTLDKITWAYQDYNQEVH